MSESRTPLPFFLPLCPSLRAAVITEAAFSAAYALGQTPCPVAALEAWRSASLEASAAALADGAAPRAQRRPSPLARRAMDTAQRFAALREGVAAACAAHSITSALVLVGPSLAAPRYALHIVFCGGCSAGESGSEEGGACECPWARAPWLRVAGEGGEAVGTHDMALEEEEGSSLSAGWLDGGGAHECTQGDCSEAADARAASDDDMELDEEEEEEDCAAVRDGTAAGGALAALPASPPLEPPCARLTLAQLSSVARKTARTLIVSGALELRRGPVRDGLSRSAMLPRGRISVMLRVREESAPRSQAQGQGALLVPPGFLVKPGFGLPSPTLGAGGARERWRFTPASLIVAGPRGSADDAVGTRAATWMAWAAPPAACRGPLPIV